LSKPFDPSEIGAYLIHKGIRYFSRRIFSGVETPVTTLVRGVCERFPKESLAITRERIFTPYPLSQLCEGMIKVAAKRTTALDGEAFQGLTKNFFGDSIEILAPPRFEFQDPQVPSDVIPCVDIRDLLEGLKVNAIGKTRVSAVLTDVEGKILAYSWSRTGINRTDHAELLLVQNFYHPGAEHFPDHSTLWVSLRPCAMCSAQILALMKHSNGFKIRFLEDDPGPMSKNSCLFEGSDLWKSAGRPAIDIKAMG
jgi:hypothetical protein